MSEEMGVCKLGYRRVGQGLSFLGGYWGSGGICCPGLGEPLPPIMFGDLRHSQDVMR